MNRLFLLAGSTVTLIVSGCEEPAPREAELPPAEAVVAPSAEDAATAAADTTAPTDPAPPLDSTQLPPANPSSEESVQPESETLFY